jgi:hypothetical protein
MIRVTATAAARRRGPWFRVRPDPALRQRLPRARRHWRDSQRGMKLIGNARMMLDRPGR